MSIVPIKDENAPFRKFLLKDIYTGQGGTGRWVPNVDDEIFDWDTGSTYRVTDVDYTTGLSTLQAYVPPSSSNSGIEEDVLLGSGPGSQSESYRVYVNSQTTPFRLALDKRLRIYGSQAMSIKIFKGTDVSDSGTVVSGMFDQNDVLISESIPLEAELNPAPGSTLVKAPVPGYATEVLNDGEVVTAVVYNNDGTPISLAKLLVQTVDHVRASNAAKKYVTGITLQSNYMSSSDNTLLQYPVNVPVQSGALVGVVEYSNGETVTLPIDGTKFQLFGTQNFVSSIVGQRVPLVLSYRLAADEFAAQVNEVGGERFITKDYSLEVMDADGAYTVKLFPFPVWVNSSVGYRLEYWLYNLDRDVAFEVTANVEAGINSDVWDGKDYGNAQNIVSAVDLEEVNGIFTDFRHVQSTEITLSTPGDSAGEKWRIRYSSGGDQYGVGLVASAVSQGGGTFDLDLSGGFATQQEWLDEVYTKLEPLYNPATEGAAPTPSHFIVTVGAYSQRRAVNQWNDTLLGITADIAQGKPVYLKFVFDTGSGDLELAIGAMPVDVSTP